MSEEVEFNNFQEKVRENQDDYKKEINKLKKLFSNRQKKARQKQLRTIIDSTNFPTFLRLYILSVRNFPSNPLHFDEEDKKEESSIARFLNIIVNEELEKIEKKIEAARASDAIFVQYKILRLQIIRNGELAYEKQNLEEYELSLIKDYQKILDESRSLE